MMVLMAFSGCIEPEVPSRERVSIAGEANSGWLPIVPMSRATIVEYDEYTYDDDLLYLASIPTAVFAGGDSLYASPVLYYQEPHLGTDTESRALNDTQGIHYFMEDYLTANEGSLDQVDIIGESNIVPYSGEDTNVYAMSPFKTSSDLALHNWRYSKEAVVVPIASGLSSSMDAVIGTMSGSLASEPLVEYNFQGSKLPDPVEPDVHEFEVPDGYSYVEALLNWTWAGQTIGPDGSAATERGKDLDLQLYDMSIGEVAASEFWNVVQENLNRPFQPPHEICKSYAFNPGDWEATVTYMPTKSIEDEPWPLTTEDSRAYYNIRVRLFPGTVLDIPDEFKYTPSDITIELDGAEDMGLILLGPAGEQVDTILDDSNPKVLELPELGTGSYSIAVVALREGAGGDFTIDYSWKHTEKPVVAHMLASAGQGAVIAAMKNQPLIYVGTGSVPSSAKKALDTLGVEKVTLVNLGDYSGVKGKFDYREWDETPLDVTEITSYKKAYNMIRTMSGENDIVFTTVGGWKYWYPGSDGPEGVHEKGTSIGPAAYTAAVHGAPMLVTEVHPELSGPAAWNNVYWANAYRNRLPPGVGSMVLTGRMVYEFLGEMGLDGLEKESIVTVAGHLNIGQAWDRVFVGAADPGRIFGSPVDQSMWVSRNAMYPLMIYANPGVNPDIDEHNSLRITGSKSNGPGPLIQPEMEIEAEFPVAQSWVSYQHRFNERASLYWGTNYVGASGVTPYWDETGHPIDEGNTNYPGSRGPGSYYPDMTTSEVVPHYADYAGYSSVFTTAFDETMENLNRGSIMWFEVMHGGHQSYGDGSGVVGFWNDDGTSRGVPGQPEPNPWRGYELNGCTEENPTDRLGPDTYTMSKQAGIDVFPAVGSDPITGELYEDHDGVIIAIGQQVTQTNLVTGTMMDDAMRNIHSVGFIAGSCLIANTYLHLTMVRHGSIFQVIDPWLTSWYSAFAIEMFMRQVALGDSVGEAYSEGMHHVGIEYLTNQWWWDIFENVVYFGDPDLYVFVPEYSWEKPVIMEASGGPQVGWHTPFGASDHPGAIEGYGNYVYITVGVVVAAVAVTYVWRRRRTVE